MPKSNWPFKVVTADGEFIAHIDRSQRNRLIGCTEEGKALCYGENGEPIFGPRLIQMHRKRSSLYYALVDAAVIRAEVKRGILNTVPRAEANRTVRRVTFGAGQYFEHHMPHCFGFPTTEASAKEHSGRRSNALNGRDNVVEFPVKRQEKEAA